MTARLLLLRRQVNVSFIFLALLSTVAPFSATNCYTPDGTISNDRPCNASASASASVCCAQGFLCTSNQLCQPVGWWDGSDGNLLQVIRGTCTDKTWAAPECQGHCVAGESGVMRCGNTTNNYCCSADDCCTKASYLKFILDEPTVTATAGIEPTSTATTTTESSRETSTATTSTGTSITPAQTTSTTSTSNDPHKVRLVDDYSHRRQCRRWGRRRHRRMSARALSGALAPEEATRYRAEQFHLLDGVSGRPLRSSGVRSRLSAISLRARLAATAAAACCGGAGWRSHEEVRLPVRLG